MIVPLAGGDRRLALYQLEGRHGADLHLDAVALVELLGEPEALLRHVELILGLDQVPVGVLHLLDGADDLQGELLAAHVAGIAGHDGGHARRPACRSPAAAAGCR